MKNQRAVINVAAVAFGAVLIWKEVKQSKKKLKQELIEINEDTDRQIEALQEAAEVVKARIRSGKYNSVKEAMTDFDFETIIKRYSDPIKGEPND